MTVERYRIRALVEGTFEIEAENYLDAIEKAGALPDVIEVLRVNRIVTEEVSDSANAEGR